MLYVKSVVRLIWVIKAYLRLDIVAMTANKFTNKANSVYNCLTKEINLEELSDVQTACVGDLYSF